MLQKHKINVKGPGQAERDKAGVRQFKHHVEMSNLTSTLTPNDSREYSLIKTGKHKQKPLVELLGSMTRK